MHRIHSLRLRVSVHFRQHCGFCGDETMKTIVLSILALSAIAASEAQAQVPYYYYPGYRPQYGNYAVTQYPNSGRLPGFRGYAAYRPYQAFAVEGGYVPAPVYAAPGTVHYRPQATTSYYRASGINSAPSPYGYDYHLSYPAAWYNGYWGW